MSKNQKPVQDTEPKAEEVEVETTQSSDQSTVFEEVGKPLEVEVEVEEPVVQEVLTNPNEPEPVVVVTQSVTTEERREPSGKADYPLSQMDGSMFAEYDSLSSSTRIAIGQVLAYTHEMRPKAPMNEKTGAKLQVSLYRSLVTILNTPQPEFNRAFSLLLKIVEKYSEGAFGARFVLRFQETVNLSASDRRLFSVLVETMRHLAPAKGRKVVAQQYDLNRVLFVGTEDTALTTAARQNFINFVTR